MFRVSEIRVVMIHFHKAKSDLSLFARQPASKTLNLEVFVAFCLKK